MPDEDGVHRAVRLIAEQSIDKASQSFSKMLRTGAAIEVKRIDMVDVAEITADLSLQNQEVIGSFVDLQGDAPFKFLFYVEMSGAFILTDLLLRKEPGTTQQCDEYVSSTVQEIGNILASSIANTFASDFQVKLRPTPPVVFNDFAATLFQELIFEAAVEENRILLIESKFEIRKVHLPCRIFLIPMPGSCKFLECAGGVA